MKDRDQNNDVMQHGDRRSGGATSYRAHQASALPDRDDAAVLGLDRAQRQDRRHDPDRQHQCHHRPADGVADADASRAVQCAAPSPDLDKVIILLTDGENTQNRWTNSQSSIDARTQKACDNAKAANIKLYTVRVIDGNATLLQACATKPDMYFNVQQASQLNSVFGSIAQNLANLRIAK